MHQSYTYLNLFIYFLQRVRKIIPSHYEMHRCQIKQKTAQTHQFDLEAQAAEIHHVAQPTEASQNIPPIHEISELSPLIPQTAQDKQFQEMHARILKEVQELLKRTSQITEAFQTAQTAQELFEQSHAALLKEAQEWLKRTSEACSAVAVLIATVAFAAAYTVPGGSNQDTGVPILLHDPFFLVFTVMDVLSLASSLTSVVMFLSILTSPFELQDFRHSLPQKLTLGFTFLFFSVAVTMLAFAATIILIIHLKKRWTTTLIYTAAFLPVSVFALLQFPLYVALMSTVRFSWKVIRSVLPSCFLPSRFKNTTMGSIYKTL